MSLMYNKTDIFSVSIFFFFGCVAFSLLCAGFLQLRQVGATLCCGAQASHCSGFSCGARALGTRASVVVAHGLSSCSVWALGHSGFSSCGARALERSLSSCGAQAQLLRGMWDLPRPGIKPVSPALAGRFLTTVTQGKSQFFKKYIYLFIWLRQVLVEAHGIFVATCGIFIAACGLFSCGMQALSCGMQDLVPRPGMGPRPPALRVWSFNHWTTREVPSVSNFDFQIFFRMSPLP